MRFICKQSDGTHRNLKTCDRAIKEEHQAKVLSETANLISLEDRFTRLCTLHESELSFAMLSGQVQSQVGVKLVELNKCSPCNRVHRKCGKCQYIYPCTDICHYLKKVGQVACHQGRGEGEGVEEVVAEEGSYAFCIPLQDLNLWQSKRGCMLRGLKRRRCRKLGWPKIKLTMPI